MLYTYTMLIVEGLRKRFGTRVALDGFDLTVHPGDVVGLVGHNGAGKTTFARVVAGLVALDAGRVTVAGIDVGHRPREARAALGWAPQELALYPTTTVRENLLLFAGLNGMSRRDGLRRARELGAALELTDVLDRRVRELSGGQQRRVQAATAMMHRPAVLLLDEPTVGADPITRRALLATVRAIADEGTAVVYTTHYLPELDVLDASLAVVRDGRVIARGRRAELLASVPGRAVLRYDGTPPPIAPSLHERASVQIDGREITIVAPDPAACVARVLAQSREVTRLSSVELAPPTLDDLYRALLEPAEALHGR